MSNRKKLKRVLVIGNDPSINEIEFDRIDPSIVTVATNRAWLKLIPDYLFFHDIAILNELKKNKSVLGELMKNSKLITSDWLKIQCVRNKVDFPKSVRLYHRPNRYKYVDCVSTAIEILDRYVYKEDFIEYYIAGVSLTWKNPSHFWKIDPIKGIGNTRGPSWYNPRFDRTYSNFVDLKSKKFKIKSVTPSSRLNKIFQYVNVGNLYA